MGTHHGRSGAGSGARPGAAELGAEAARRSRVCWLRPLAGPGDDRARLAWHVWHDDALVVLAGRTSALALAEGPVEVVMRSKDTRTRLATWTGAAETLLPGDQRWAGHVHALLGVRLNLADPQATAAQWRESSAIVRITPLREH